jgi:hypothetical protein
VEESERSRWALRWKEFLQEIGAPVIARIGSQDGRLTGKRRARTIRQRLKVARKFSAVFALAPLVSAGPPTFDQRLTTSMVEPVSLRPHCSMGISEGYHGGGRHWGVRV